MWLTTFQRGILQGGDNSPQGLFTEALFGTGILDVTSLVDPTGSLLNDRAALQAWEPASELVDACNTLQAAIVADDDAWTVTFHLEQAWSPFLGTLTHTAGSIMDQDWTINNGGWDGDCNTWQNYYYHGILAVIHSHRSRMAPGLSTWIIGHSDSEIACGVLTITGAVIRTDVGGWPGRVWLPLNRC